MTESEHRSKVAALLMRHHDALYAYVLACLRSHNDVDDVLQNVSIAVIETALNPDRTMMLAQAFIRRWRVTARLPLNSGSAENSGDLTRARWRLG